MESAKSKSPEQKPRIEIPNKSMTGTSSLRSSSRMHSNIEHSIMEQALADAFLVYMGLEVSTPYRCFDYLSTSPDHPPTDAYNDYVDHIFSSLPSDPSGPMTEVWRERICEWCFQVVDHFDYSRELVGIATSYLDRYLSKKKVNKKIFQLAAMTSLYISIKLNASSPMKINTLIGLSRGFFQAAHIVDMEQSILRTLDWRMNPPTVMAAIRNFFKLIPLEVASTARNVCLELSRFLAELSVCDYYFTDKRPSHTALACILTAFEGQTHDNFPKQYRQKFVDQAFRIGKVNCTVQEVHDSRLKLREIYQNGQFHKQKNERSGGQSPSNVQNGSCNDGDEHSADDVGQNMNSSHVMISSAYVSDEPMDGCR